MKLTLNFIKNFGDPYDDIARDEFGKQSVNFGIYGIPESILINKELIIIKKFIGPLSNEDFNFIKINLCLLIFSQNYCAN